MAMKRPTHKHLPRNEVYCPKLLDAVALQQLSERVFYRGSKDHKGVDNSFGFKHTPPRPDASVCDKNITPEIAQNLLRESICKGNIQWTVATEKHPRYVWGKFEGQLYLARLTNDGKGEYKGYPVQESVIIKGFIE